jgi:hypothetical protein
MYGNGKGVPEDDKEAVKWYRLAAEQGHLSAQHKLGLMYDNGEGLPEDDKAAVKWYRLAADQGLAEAQYSVGVMYANGEGVAIDYVLAYMWANIAGANGLDVSKFKGFLTEKLTQADMSKVQELTRQYIKDNPEVY